MIQPSSGVCRASVKVWTNPGFSRAGACAARAENARLSCPEEKVDCRQCIKRSGPAQMRHQPVTSGKPTASPSETPSAVTALGLPISCALKLSLIKRVFSENSGPSAIPRITRAMSIPVSEPSKGETAQTAAQIAMLLNNPCR